MTKKQRSEDNWDDESNAVPSLWVKFNVSAADDAESCDKIFGTLVSKRQIKSTMQGKEGEMVNVYEIKATKETSFHVLDEKKKLVEDAIVINPGDVYSVGGTKVIDNQMRNVKVGQQIGLKFVEEQPSKTKGFAPAKIVRVFAPKNNDGTVQMDEEWLAEQGQSELDKEFDK